MRNEDMGLAVLIGGATVVISAIIGWWICYWVGGYFADKLASAYQFGGVGVLIGLWLGYHLAVGLEIPILAMVGAATAAYWWIGLRRISEVLRTGPTSVSEALGQQGMRFTIPGYVPLPDIWYVNLIVGVIAGALVFAQLSQERRY